MTLGLIFALTLGGLGFLLLMIGLPMMCDNMFVPMGIWMMIVAAAIFILSLIIEYTSTVEFVMGIISNAKNYTV